MVSPLEARRDGGASPQREDRRGGLLAVGDHGFLVLARTDLPLATTPTRQDEWVRHAVHQKIAKNYVSGTPAVLVIRLCSPLRLTRFEVERWQRRSVPSEPGALAVNNYGDPPVRSRRNFNRVR
jgi:hypothetical protein